MKAEARNGFEGPITKSVREIAQSLIEDCTSYLIKNADESRYHLLSGNTFVDRTRDLTLNGERKEVLLRGVWFRAPEGKWRESRPDEIRVEVRNSNKDKEKLYVIDQKPEDIFSHIAVNERGHDVVCANFIDIEEMAEVVNLVTTNSSGTA